MSFGLSAANATTTYSCSLGGNFKVDANVVSDGVTCSGVAVIPAGVTAIGVEAFRGATGLTSITLPARMTSIGDSAFYLATSLNNVSIPSTVTSIGSLAFYEARELTSIIIPSGVTSIESLTFYGAAKLSSVSFAAGSLLTQIKNQAFEKNYMLESITIPAGVTEIGNRAFSDATSLSSVTFASDRNLLSIGFGAFYHAPITNIVIPSSVTTIGDYAFEETSLTSIYFLSNTAPEMYPSDSPFYNIVPAPKAFIRDAATGFDSLDDTFPTGHGLEIEVGVYSVEYNNQSATTAQLGGSSYYLKGSAIVEIPTTPPAKNDHAFAGWYTAASGGVEVTNNSYTPISPYGAKTLYAKWNRIYTVTYSYNSATGGNTVASSTFVTGGTAITLPAPTRTGYTFAGWYSDAGLTSKIADAGSSYSPTGETAALSAYANWTRNPVKAAATVKPKISGTAKVKKTLTAKKGTWTGYPTPKYSYQWYACSKKVTTTKSKVPSTCKKISGATKSTLKLKSSQKNKYISVLVSATSKGTAKVTWLSKSTKRVG